MQKVLFVAVLLGIVGVAVGTQDTDIGADRRLPPTFGIGVNYYQQDQGYILNSLKVDVLSGNLADLADLEGVDIDNEVQEMNVKVDMWILPFLNLFGLLGNVDGETTVNTDLFDNFRVDYEGVVYGAGVTMAGGWKRLFGTLTATITETDLDTSSSSVQAWILTPKVGMSSRYGAVWVGGMYQQAEEQHQGRIVIPVYDEVEYDVEFEQQESWNAVVGFATGLSRNWYIDLEGGFGDRTHASFSTTYRF